MSKQNDPSVSLFIFLFITNQEKLAVKIGVKTRGCNGLSYTMNYSNQPGKFDEVIEYKGINFLI